MDYAGVQMAEWTTIRRELRAVRKERRITLRVLHDKTGISPSTVNRIERVEKYPNHKPDLDTLQVLTRAMGVPLSEFFGRIEGLKPQRHTDNNLPSPTQSELAEGARGGGQISGGGIPSDKFVNEAILIGIAEQLADRITSAVDKAVTRLAESRRQDATPRPPAPLRHARSGKAR